MLVLNRLTAYREYRKKYPEDKDVVRKVDRLFSRPHSVTHPTCDCKFCIYDRGDDLTWNPYPYNPYIHEVHLLSLDIYFQFHKVKGILTLIKPKERGN